MDYIICKDKKGIDFEQIIFLTLFAIISIGLSIWAIPSVSATITLNDFNYSISSNCQNEDIKINIIPLNLSNSKIENVNISNSLNSPFFLDNESNFMGFYINLNESQNITISVIQGKKEVTKEIEIKLSDCNKFEKLKNTIGKIENFIKTNYLIIIITIFLILCIIMILIIKNK